MTKKVSDPTERTPTKRRAQQLPHGMTIGERRREIIMKFQGNEDLTTEEEHTALMEFGRISQFGPLRTIETQIGETEAKMEELLTKKESVRGPAFRTIERQIRLVGEQLSELTRSRIRILQKPLSDIRTHDNRSDLAA